MKHIDCHQLSILLKQKSLVNIDLVTVMHKFSVSTDWLRSIFPGKMSKGKASEQRKLKKGNQKRKRNGTERATEKKENITKSV